ncbi:MAG TPA: hypothetical protein RMH26_16685 [Polyangiaceae bacterium LLY-WYZ-15_(1-7)]|nr:hypothetical protein [Polyangiaceae bacterium LLY-WYZ-15_(1-7)]
MKSTRATMTMRATIMVTKSMQAKKKDMTSTGATSAARSESCTSQPWR